MIKIPYLILFVSFLFQISSISIIHDKEEGHTCPQIPDWKLCHNSTDNTKTEDARGAVVDRKRHSWWFLGDILQSEKVVVYSDKTPLVKKALYMLIAIHYVLNMSTVAGGNKLWHTTSVYTIYSMYNTLLTYLQHVIFSNRCALLWTPQNHKREWESWYRNSHRKDSAINMDFGL